MQYLHLVFPTEAIETLQRKIRRLRIFTVQQPYKSTKSERVVNHPVNNKLSKSENDKSIIYK